MIDTECERCGELYNLSPGDDPTPHCHPCAHELVAKLTEQNAKLIQALRPFAALVQYDGTLAGALMADVYRHAARVLKEIEDGKL